MLWNDSQAFRAGNIGLDTDFSKQKLHGFRLAVKCGFQGEWKQKQFPLAKSKVKYGRISGILRRQNIFCRRHNRLYGSADVIFLTVQLQLLLVVSFVLHFLRADAKHIRQQGAALTPGIPCRHPPAQNQPAALFDKIAKLFLNRLIHSFVGKDAQGLRFFQPLHRLLREIAHSWREARRLQHKIKIVAGSGGPLPDQSRIVLDAEQ